MVFFPMTRSAQKGSTSLRFALLFLSIVFGFIVIPIQFSSSETSVGVSAGSDPQTVQETEVLEAALVRVLAEASQAVLRMMVPIVKTLVPIMFQKTRK
jgi:uncharacterized protein (UPF0333 family)